MFRSDISVDWRFFPRIITIQAPSVEIEAQDLVDTLRVLEYRPGEGLNQPHIIDAVGKTALGSVKTGITVTLRNAVIHFETRTLSHLTSFITSSSVDGTSLNDSTAQFITNNTQPGSWVVNMTDRSVGTVLRVRSETLLETSPLGDGADNNWQAGDVYKIWPVTQTDITGGNVTAIDDNGDQISPLLPSAGIYPVRTSDVSAALVDVNTGSGLSPAQATQLSEIYKILGLELGTPLTASNIASLMQAGTIILDISGDDNARTLTRRP